MKKWFKTHRKKKIALTIVLAILVLFMVICGVALWSIQKGSVKIVDPSKVDPKAKKVAIAKSDQKNKDVINVLLVGSDTRDPNAEMGRSDSMILVSYNKKENKATIASFMRDALVDIDGYGQSKLGHTFAYGGAGLTINTINKDFDLDVQNYIAINFENLIQIVDAVDGIRVPFTAEEAEYYRNSGIPDAIEGMNTLTGAQALAHARNRSLDNDFGRTHRQRDVLNGIYQKILERKDPAVLLPLINFCMTQVTTNMSVTEIYSLAKKVLASDNLLTQQTSIPAEGTYTFGTYEEMSVLEFDMEQNKEILNTLLY